MQEIRCGNCRKKLAEGIFTRLSIRANRLKEKEAIRTAASMTDIEVAKLRWVKFRRAIRVSLGISE